MHLIILQYNPMQNGMKHQRMGIWFARTENRTAIDWKARLELPILPTVSWGLVGLTLSGAPYWGINRSTEPHKV
jgi:hypothetical protein